jgi:hypothetical protein
VSRDKRPSLKSWEVYILIWVVGICVCIYGSCVFKIHAFYGMKLSYFLKVVFDSKVVSNSLKFRILGRSYCLSLLGSFGGSAVARRALGQEAKDLDSGHWPGRGVGTETE